jgi:hypothetical protein
MALFWRAERTSQCPKLGGERTQRGHAATAESDPYRTLMLALKLAQLTTARRSMRSFAASLRSTFPLRALSRSTSGVLHKIDLAGLYLGHPNFFKFNNDFAMIFRKLEEKLCCLQVALLSSIKDHLHMFLLAILLHPTPHELYYGQG